MHRHVGEIIKEKTNKIKSIKEITLIFIVFVLFNILSFALGVLAGKDKSAIKIMHTNLQKHLPTQDLSFVLASKHGKKYYYLWCSGINNISFKNRIYFKDKTEAERVGYTLSSTCKNRKNQ